MFTMQAPHPDLTSGILLPNPEFSDGERISATIQIIRSMNGKKRSYVKTKTGRRTLTWEFNLRRPKALELKEFYRVYHSFNIKVTDHNNRIWVGYFSSNPIVLTNERAANPVDEDVRGEMTPVQVEFKGIEQ